MRLVHHIPPLEWCPASNVARVPNTGPAEVRRDHERSYRPWQGIIAPLPRNVFITGEHAERLGRTALKRLAYQLGDNVLRDRFTTGDVALRTYGLMAHEFRATFERRLPENVARLFRYTTWPKGVWVVEALDRERWDNGSTDRRDCVLGEVVIDATALVRPSFEDIRRPPSDDRVEDAAGDRVDDVVAQHDGPLDDIWRSVVGIHVTGHAYVFPPGELVQETGPPVTAFEPYATGCPVAPW